jgi:hypothetical protein
MLLSLILRSIQTQISRNRVLTPLIQLHQHGSLAFTDSGLPVYPQLQKYAAAKNGDGRTVASQAPSGLRPIPGARLLAAVPLGRAQSVNSTGGVAAGSPAYNSYVYVCFGFAGWNGMNHGWNMSVPHVAPA